MASQIPLNPRSPNVSSLDVSEVKSPCIKIASSGEGSQNAGEEELAVIEFAAISKAAGDVAAAA